MQPEASWSRARDGSSAVYVGGGLRVRLGAAGKYIAVGEYKSPYAALCALIRRYGTGWKQTSGAKFRQVRRPASETGVPSGCAMRDGVCLLLEEKAASPATLARVAVYGVRHRAAEPVFCRPLTLGELLEALDSPSSPLSAVERDSVLQEFCV